MFKNYLKIAWRNLLRNKGFSLINLLGLTIGISCTIFMFLWVKDEITFDKFHKNYDNVYQAMAHRDFNNTVFTDENMVFPLTQELQTGYPQIKNAVVATQTQTSLVEYNHAKLSRDILYVSDGFFKVFSWKFIKGNAATAITDPASVVLTQSAAKSFFGDNDPINKIVKLNNSENYKVTAVIEDIPGNSTLRFDGIIPINFSTPEAKRDMTEWVNSSWRVFIQAAPGVSEAQIGKIVGSVMKSHNTNDKVSTYFAFPMSKWHLSRDFKDGKNVGGMIDYVKLITVIALVILLIACVNFMNLSTARSEKRAREVGIRKTLGSDKRQLVLQFFSESMILSLIAFLFAIIVVVVLMPWFNQLVTKQLFIDITDPLFWGGAVFIIIFTGITAGSYPALYLSSFNPIKVLKGTVLVGKSADIPRRILVVGQFVMSILLVSATIVVYQQIQHVKNRDAGYNASNLIMVPATPMANQNYAVIKQELLKTGTVSSVTRTFSPITDIWWSSPAPKWPGKPAGTEIIFSGMYSDVDFSKTMGVKILEGRDFNGMPADTASMLLNKSAVEAMGLKQPLGIKLTYGPHDYTVIGITDNIIMTSPYNAVNPMMTYYNPAASNWITIRLNKNAQPKQALKAFDGIFKKHSPDDLFDYQFVDEEFGQKFATEELISRISNIFAGLAIFICCLGLAGLASFTIEKRIREIGIRKVLGATIQQVLMLISKEFLKLVLVAFVIAVPLTWWLMYNWLQKYAYHTEMSIWMFGIVGIAILLLTLTVVTLNTFRAAASNPVKSLRSE